MPAFFDEYFFGTSIRGSYHFGKSLHLSILGTGRSLGIAGPRKAFFGTSNRRQSGRARGNGRVLVREQMLQMEKQTIES